MIQGNIEDGLSVYRGIPYAAPLLANEQGLKETDGYFEWRRTVDIPAKGVPGN